MNTKLKTNLVIMLLAVCAVTAAQAQTDTSNRGRIQPGDGPQFEIYASSLLDASEATTGLRGSYPITRRFALEGSVSRFGDFDVWLADLSAKYYLKTAGRTGVYVLGGPGLAFASSGSGTETMVHLGLGLEILIGQRMYLRPEVRERAVAEDLGSSDTDVSLGFGWRF